ncbi:MAG TPA: hypothetical protein VF705_06710, partial [Longimicrobium sp.]
MQSHSRLVSLPGVAVALLLSVAPSAAQSDAQTVQTALNNVRLLDPELESPVRSGVPAVVLSALRGDGEARAQAGFALGQLNAVVAASAPFTGKTSDPDTELATEAGLAGGTTLSLTVSGLVWGPSRITNAQAVARGDWCAAKQAAGWFSQSEISCDAISRNKLVSLGTAAPALTRSEVAALVGEFRNATDKRKWCGDQIEARRIPRTFSCTGVTQEKLEGLAFPRSAHAPDSVDVLVRDFDRVSRLGWDIPVQYGLQAKVSPQDFDFLDATTLATGS